MALVEREDVSRPVSVREDDHRRIGEPEIKVCVSLKDIDGGIDVVLIERFGLKRAVRDLGEERSLSGCGDPRGKQVVQLGKHERGEQSGSPAARSAAAASA